MLERIQKKEGAIKIQKALYHKARRRASSAFWESKGKEDPSGLTMEISGAEINGCTVRAVAGSWRHCNEEYKQK